MKILFMYTERIATISSELKMCLEINYIFEVESVFIELESK